MYNKEHIFILRETLDLKLFFLCSAEALVLVPVANILRVGTRAAEPGRCY